jgi:hypothetical protein
MLVKVTKRQFELLLKNFDLIGSRGLKLTMSGDAFNKIMPDINQINEQKMFKVDLWVGAYPIKVVIFSDNSNTARIVAGKLFPQARVYFASEIKGKIS